MKEPWESDEEWIHFHWKTKLSVNNKLLSTFLMCIIMILVPVHQIVQMCIQSRLGIRYIHNWDYWRRRLRRYAVMKSERWIELRQWLRIEDSLTTWVLLSIAFSFSSYSLSSSLSRWALSLSTFNAPINLRWDRNSYPALKISNQNIEFEKSFDSWNLGILESLIHRIKTKKPRTRRNQKYLRTIEK